MVLGQKIVISDSGTVAHFEYTGDLGSNQVQLTFLAYDGDAAPLTVFSAGSGVSPAGTQPSAVSATQVYDYKAVTDRDNAYEFTTGYAQLAFSGTNQSITLTEAGTYMLKARVRVDYSFATYVFAADGSNFADQILQLKLIDTSRGAAPGTTIDSSNASGDTESSFIMPNSFGGAQEYQSLGWLTLPPVFYATPRSTDTIGIFGKVGKVPDNTTEGKLLAFEASLVAVRVSDVTS
jgi:hypothetical protein